MKKLLTILVMIVFAASMIFMGVGCKEEGTDTEEIVEEEGTAGEEATAEDEDVEEEEVVAQEEEVYVQVVTVYGVPYWSLGRSGWEDAAAFFGVTAEYTGQDDTDPVVQSRILDEQIARGVDGICLSPADSVAVNPAIERVIDAGIPLVTYIADSPDSKRLSFIGQDTYYWGVLAAEALAEAVDYKGQVAQSYGGGNPSQEEMARAYADVIAKYPDMELVALVTDAFDLTTGVTAISSLLQKYPDLAGIGGSNSTSGACAAQAAIESGYEPGDIKIIALGSNNDVLQYIMDGWIQESYTLNDYITGWYAMEQLYWYNHMEELMPNATPDIMKWKENNVPIAQHIDTQAYVINKDNAEIHFR